MDVTQAAWILLFRSEWAQFLVSEATKMPIRKSWLT